MRFITEYFKRSGKINVDQLEKAIIAQKESVKSNKPLRIAEIMISMGYITEKDTTSLLLIKDESKKRFILDASIIPAQFASPLCDEHTYKEEIARLTAQNLKFKQQLKRVIAFLKKNG